MGEDLSPQQPLIDSKDIPSSDLETAPLQMENIGYNTIVSVPLHNGQNLSYMGGELIAKLQLGGTAGDDAHEGLPEQQLDIYSIQHTEDSDYKRLLNNAVKDRSTSKIVAVRPPDETQQGAIGFIPENHPSTIGRESSIQWYDLSTHRPLDESHPLFNKSVSRRQLAVHVRDTKLIFIGASTAPEGYSPSRTIIEAPSIDKLGN